MPSTNYDKFCLLLWKNWTLQWNHKWQCLFEICAPVVFSLLLVFVRLFVESTHIGELRFTKSFEMKDFSLLRENYAGYVDYRVAYSPASCTFCRNIMQEALGVAIQPCESSSVMQTTVAEELLLAGVDFGDSNEHARAYPRKFVFSIRFPSELRVHDRVIQIWNTNKLFMPLDPFGPRNRLDEDGGAPTGYLRGGFLTIQNQVSLAYIKLATANRSRRIPPIKIKRFPYPPFVEDLLLKGLSAIIALIILLCYIQPATYTVKYVALEKEKQLKEVLKIMGLSNWLHWTAWFVKTFITLFLSTLLIGFFLTTKWSSGVAVITYSSFTVFIFFLLVYVITSITFCFMMATLFNKASTAAAVTGLYWFLSFIPFTYISINYEHIPITSKYLWCFIANTCMGLGTRVIVEWEMTGQGLNWETLFEESSAGDPLKMIHIIAMMLATAVIHMLVCLYIEQVRPGTYGIPKPWNFPFRKGFWLGEPIRNVPRQPISRDRRENAVYFEKEPENKEAGVVISSLSKSFGARHVVRNLSFNMYRNEITVLLGHNGAGKTTTISILIGMIQPTSGTAYIMGHDIRTDIDGAREHLSICPQHNVLFDDLTVRDHLKFFAYLRGLRGDELEDEVQNYLEKIDLEKKADTLASNLSGGMQRKLSVSCALCGGPLVVLCDEPSSGMDPTARRQLWNILQQEKEGRIILLTTHFMDEADVLADRIAIMAGGQLKCYGTSFFLKKKVGTGYTLVCVKDKQCDSSAVTAFLQDFIPNLELAEETDTEISYTLEEKHSTVFSEMLNGLENASTALGISGFGLSNTSLEEVFLKMGAETFATDAKKTDATTDSVNFSVRTRLKGRDLTSSQIQSMILKKYLSTRRNSALIAVNLVMVIAFVILSVVVKATELFPRQRPLAVGLQQYKEASVVLETPNAPPTKSITSDIAKNYERFVRDAGSRYNLIYTRGLPFEAFILSHPVRLQHKIDSKFIAGATIRDDEFMVWLNNKPLHSAPLTLNILHNAIARTLLGERAEIVVINHPLPYIPETRMSVADTGLGLGTQLATNVGFSMSIITALFCVFIIKERQSRAKLLQFVSGVKGLTFWLTHFIWDFTYFTTLALVLVVFLGWFEEEAYSHFEELARNFIILLCFAFSALPLTYLMSRRYTEPANGFAKLSMFNIFFGVGVFAIALVLSFEVLDLRDVGHSLETFVLAYPHFALAKALHTLYINQMLHIVCQPLLALDDDERCERYGHCCKVTPYFAWERPGVGRPIVYLLVSGAIYSFLVISIQYRLLGAMWDKYQSKKALKRHTFGEPMYFDSDVDKERKLIDQMTKEEIGRYNLVMKRLTKFYGNFLAVNQLSVAIKEAECFGLLGLNGAGKSTTFKMLTLDVNTTFGRAYVKGMNIQTQTKDVYQEIGYCPQFGGLFNDFTGRETLRLFAMIHGIPKKRIAELSENLAKAFGFIKHYDNRVGNYSGGNKRKLSTAVAVIGGPSVVLLDEPTSGMDPASRRRLWNVINSIRKAGKSIVLTSHSMDECVALCTRMGIMVNGEFRCLGSIQHLRIKYSQGLVLKIKVMSIQYSRMARPSVGRRISWRGPANLREKSVEMWVKANFPDAKLEDKFQGLLSFNIPMSEHLWSRLFGKIEENKQALFIEDYSISQTNLEEIFLYFTKH